MLKVGLTGGIATGKSNVLRLLRELGCETSDADQMAHAAIAPGQPAFAEIIQDFGSEVLKEDGTIDRARLGRIVFADGDRRQRLNAIVHPRVFEAQTHWYQEVESRRPDAIAVVDAALMIETGSFRRFDLIVVVYCRPELQVERLMERSQLSRDDALARINAQMPAEEKLKHANYVIDTSGGFAETRIQVETLYTNLQEKQRES
ncbi:MAG: dephospho-CoA kinase [Acidobacteriota bacterium]